MVRKVAKRCNFRVKEIEEDHDGGVVTEKNPNGKLAEWDVSWHDLAITADFFAKMQVYQKVNHFPGMYVVTRKNHLARNLMRMQRAFPKEYNFFPQTWLLPSEAVDFSKNFDAKGGLQGAQGNGSKKKKPVTFIVKPEAQS